MILGLIDEAITDGARLEPVCEVLGLTLRTVQRWKCQGVGDDRRAGPRTKPANALTDTEKANALDIANSAEFRDKSPKQFVPILADRGQFIASEATFYRLLRDANQIRHRERSREPSKRSRPTAYTATAPNQLWSWDITYLKSTVKGSFFYLYSTCPAVTCRRGLAIVALVEGESSVSLGCHFDLPLGPAPGRELRDARGGCRCHKRERVLEVSLGSDSRELAAHHE